MVAEAVTQLSAEHRAVLLECYYRGRSVAEASRRLGVPEGTVKSRTHYALRALRLALQEMGVAPMTESDRLRARARGRRLRAGRAVPRGPARLRAAPPDCPDCAQSVRELAGIPGLLARVPVEIVDPDQLPSPVPDTLLPALVRRVRRTERRRTWLTAGLVGVAAAVAVAAIGFATLVATTTRRRRHRHPRRRRPPHRRPRRRSMRPVGDEPISGWLSLTEVGWGTRLDLTCSYAAESHDYADPSWSTYTMFVRTADGAVEQVASWKALPGKTMHLAAATAADRDDIVPVEVRTSAGEPVLELDAETRWLADRSARSARRGTGPGTRPSATPARPGRGRSPSCQSHAVDPVQHRGVLGDHRHRDVVVGVLAADVGVRLVVAEHDQHEVGVRVGGEERRERVERVLDRLARTPA